MEILIRVSAKTSAGEHRTISVVSDGSKVFCNCGGFDGIICSHVDAVLIARERAMVVAEDQPAAERACDLVASWIAAPAEWRGAWRKNLRWRGITSRGASRRKRDNSRPLVCFTGKLDLPRSQLLSEAVNAGWETIDAPSPYLDVLVAADPTAFTAKLKAARKNGTPIISREEWSSLMTDGAYPAQEVIYD